MLEEFSLESAASFIRLPDNLYDDSLSLDRLSEEANCYFFRVDNFLHLNSDRTDYDMVGREFRLFCLREGIGIYSKNLLTYLKGLSTSDWGELFRLASDEKIDSEREEPIDIHPEDIDEAREYLRELKKEVNAEYLKFEQN